MTRLLLRRGLMLFVVGALAASMLLVSPSAGNAQTNNGNGPTAIAVAPTERGVAPVGDDNSGPAAPNPADPGQGEPPGGSSPEDPDAQARIDAKAEEARARGEGKPGAEALGPEPTTSEEPSAPPTFRVLNREGMTQAEGGLIPPDPHLAVGLSQTIQVVNARIQTRRKVDGFMQMNKSLADFFLAPGTFIFDPRAVYDPLWDRWIVIATERAANNTDPINRIFLAISKGFSGSANWWIYHLSDDANAGNWHDYPMLGFNEDAIVYTTNMFRDHDGSSSTGDQYQYTSMTAIAKSRLYNGSFTGGAHTYYAGGWGFSSQPTIVQQVDAVPDIYFTSMDFANDQIDVISCRNLARFSTQTCGVETSVGIGATDPPPSADQPGHAVNIDVIGGRFQNAGAQIGNTVYQTNTVALGSFPAPRFYQLDLGPNTLVQSDVWFADGDSHDFNPAIVANQLGEVGVVWSVTFGAGSGFPEMRTTGRQQNDALNFMPNGGNIRFTSPSFINNLNSNGTLHRWGDYAAAVLDPRGYPNCAPFRTLWATNEVAAANNTWRTGITRYSFCP